MKNKEELYSKIEQINQQEAKQLQQLIGDYDFARYVLRISRIDEPAETQHSLLVVTVPQIIAGFPPQLMETPVGRTALEDLLTRKVAEEIDKIAAYDEDGISRRRLHITRPGQKILPRSSLVITEEYVQARVYIRLPLRDGRILGPDLNALFFEILPIVVNAALIYCNLDENEIAAAVSLMNDADHVRRLLATRGWVSFVADRARLCRAGNTDRPAVEHANPLVVDETLARNVDVPHAGALRGFGVPTGLTLILGDAYSGRAELMRAISAGIYNHIADDGREMVITVPDAVYVKAEPGRSVQRVDISAFVRPAGGGASPAAFTDLHADACAAQAASTIEALEVGARALLFDESDSAVEFLARDARLCGLLPEADRAITPLSALARRIVDQLGVSLVVAGSSTLTDFIPVADTILRIANFKVSDITQQAKALVAPPETAPTGGDVSALLAKKRSVVPSSIDPSANRSDVRIETKGMYQLQFGRNAIDLQGVAQLADEDQTRTIGRILYYAKTHYMDEIRTISEILDSVDQDLSMEGLETITHILQGDLARPRRYEIAAALNRLPALRIIRAT
ncbi:MAG: hypothetical protein NTV49_02410 [Kiritimatiellaeota bacterium]|nr:hypothetical protein [Kiritimatiellota bacterium]